MIEWQYFFGGVNQRYYYAVIDGQRVENYSHNGKNLYSVGNMDEAIKKYTSEDELLAALKPNPIISPL